MIYLLTRKHQVVREYYATHVPTFGSVASSSSFSDYSGIRIEPKIWEQMTEDSDEWNAFLRYNQRIVDHKFKLEE